MSVALKGYSTNLNKLLCYVDVLALCSNGQEVTSWCGYTLLALGGT